jgi:hypothetical protein
VKGHPSFFIRRRRLRAAEERFLVRQETADERCADLSSMPFERVSFADTQNGKGLRPFPFSVTAPAISR